MSTMDIIGFAALALHVLVIFVIVLWFALGKPKSRTIFWQRFCHELLGLPQKKTSTPR